MDIVFEKGIVAALNATNFIGSIYINGMTVERIVNEKGAVWIVFKSHCDKRWGWYDSIQYTPGGCWEFLDKDGNIV